MELSEINGVGPKTEKLFNKLNIYSGEDLISYYPFRYNIFKYTDLNENNVSIINGIVESLPVVFYIKKNFNKMSFRFLYKDKLLNVSIFNRAFMKNNITVGKNITIIGKYDSKKNQFVCSDIKFNILDGQIEPIYHQANGINSNLINKCIKEALIKSSVLDLIPQEYISKYNMIPKREAINLIHFPKTSEDIKKAKIRLIYEELFDFSFKMNYLTKTIKSESGIAKQIDKQRFNKFLTSLPFLLTKDQQNALEDIINDMEKPQQLNRLILGDVGSGKTIVAVASIYANFLAGFQSALMAPTEILACQHYESIVKTLDKFNINISLVTGSMTKKAKLKVYNDVRNGKVDLLIGTHALLNDDLEFSKLGLVITDEQHRFGVNQRSLLMKKGFTPDIIYLSATPIPRTYAMTIYGDLDISMIKTKPNGRKPIITKVVKEENIKEVLSAMLDEIKLGHQIYIVSPLVDQNDNEDLKSVTLLKEKMMLAFKGIVSCEIIHGKMKQKEKDEIMQNFKSGSIRILISTTVIEVGIDVPNSTMMIIFNAERFGLATLHQLRGRVGRNDLQSYCYLISNYEKDRLKVMEESNDGFYISQKDFELRGHGDLFGTRQSGDMAFKIADLRRDYEILVKVQKDVSEYISTHLYEDNEYYQNLSKSLDIVD